MLNDVVLCCVSTISDFQSFGTHKDDVGEQRGKRYHIWGKGGTGGFTTAPKARFFPSLLVQPSGTVVKP